MIHIIINIVLDLAIYACAFFLGYTHQRLSILKKKMEILREAMGGLDASEADDLRYHEGILWTLKQLD